MWIARLIGTNIEVISEDMEEAYNVITEFDHGVHKVSMRYIPNTR